MAARLNPTPAGPPEIVDLRRLSARDMEPLLQEESAAWRDELEWDFEKSAALVRRFVELRALNGCALVEDNDVTGYLYYVIEDNKGLIGDLYVRHEWSSADRERMMLDWGIEAVIASPSVTRIESQLMMLRFQHSQTMPRPRHASAFERNFMRVDLRRAQFGEGKVRRPMYLERWSDQYSDSASQLIAAAYQGHIDSRINDQYRSAGGALRFLYNIVQYPGCGAFFRPASYAAFEAASGHMCGISLASVVAPESGHITQICVSPEVKGRGVGHALLRQSLIALRDHGCKSVSLTVTAANVGAVELYERMGFVTMRRFSALVWEGF